MREVPRYAGAPEEIRTPDPQIRSYVLRFFPNPWPVEQNVRVRGLSPSFSSNFRRHSATLTIHWTNIQVNWLYGHNADTSELMTHGKLSEETVKRLPIPDKGNRVTYFAGATLQGAKAPRGFGVRVTAAGARAFVLNYRLRGREHRFTIGAWPDWSALKAVREARNLRQRIDRG